MQRILFLDFDGVLHGTSEPPGKHFSRCLFLEEALGQTDCGIVISSSWRHHHRPAEIIARLPASLQTRVIGMTGEPYVGSLPRYNEIRAFIARSNTIADWRALDDSWYEFPRDLPQLILCDPNTGITSREVAKLKDWLAGS